MVVKPQIFLRLIYFYTEMALPYFFFFLPKTFSRAGQSLCTQIVKHIKQVLDFNTYEKKNIAEPIIGYMPRSTS